MFRNYINSINQHELLTFIPIIAYNINYMLISSYTHERINLLERSKCAKCVYTINKKKCLEKSNNAHSRALI